MRSSERISRRFRKGKADGLTVRAWEKPERAADQKRAGQNAHLQASRFYSIAGFVVTPAERLPE
jgi:hypothetical protein